MTEAGRGSPIEPGLSAISDLNRSISRSVKVRPRYLNSVGNILPSLAWHFDEPFADASAIPTWHLAQLTRSEVTVALTGDGGDEALGGYDRYRALLMAERLAWIPRPLRVLSQKIVGLGPGSPRGAKLQRFLGGLDLPAVLR